jgi:uncharacterized membrane protein YjdF
VTDRRYPAVLLAVFAGWWLLLAIDPLYREDWFLENVLVLVAIPLLVRGHRTLPLSRRAYTGLFVFLMLQEVGAHYTYSLVPYDAAAHAVAYEVIEWLAAEAFGGDLGTAYLGTQGDGFDAPKDMALAVAGSLVALAWLSRPRRGSSSAPRSSASASAPGASTVPPRRPSSRAARARSATTS